MTRAARRPFPLPPAIRPAASLDCRRIDRRAQRSARPVARTSAFTLIELLVVVGILGLLTALAVVGFRVVGGAGKAKVTGTALENCQGLVSNYKLTKPLEDLFDSSTLNALTSGSAAATGSYNVPFRWRMNKNGLANDILSAQVVTPGTVAAGTVQPDLAMRAVHERYLRDESARVIRRLMSVPENRKSVETIPPDRLAKVRFPVNAETVLAPSTTGADPEYPVTPATDFVESVVLLDGSGHPIYFIPGGGIANVNVGYVGTGDKADKTNYDRQVTIRAGDRNPFWASPGPDGDLTTGDDNLYSTAVETK